PAAAAPAPATAPEPASAPSPPVAPAPVAAAPPPTGVIDLGVPAEPAPEAKPKKSGDESKLQLASANGDHKIEFHGLIQGDGRFFLTDKGGISTFLVRRARPDIEAKLFK